VALCVRNGKVLVPLGADNEGFNLVIDKGTVDALVCLGEDGEEKGKRMVKVRNIQPSLRNLLRNRFVLKRHAR
jgi:hypothetical protein